MELKPYLRKVHYYETDKMGITHHSNYIRWMEEARIDFLDQIGWGFDKLEAMGMVSPVLAVNCRYKETTAFHDEVSINVTVKELKGVRMTLEYIVKNTATGHEVLTGTTEHTFLDSRLLPIRLKKEFPEFYQVLCENCF